MVQLKASSLSERVVIKPLIEKVSKGGIVISRSERDQAISTNQGTVYLIGPLAWYDLPHKPDIKVGDKVYYSKYGGMTLKIDGIEDFLVICNDKDILIAYEGDGTGDVDE